MTKPNAECELTDRIGMRAVLVLGAVGRVAERLAASLILAHVRLLAGVRAQVSLEVLQPRVRLVAALKLHTSTIGRVSYIRISLCYFCFR